MKKYLIFAFAALLLLACQKNNQDNSQKPAITWQANENFAEMEITTDMDAKVALSVPEGTASLKITVSKLPVELIGIANKLIGSSANKGTGSKSAVFDLIDDATAVSALSRIGFLSGNPRTSNLFTLDFSKLLWELAADSPLENASKFVFDIALEDNAKHTLSKSVRFNWTSAPVIVKTPDGEILLAEEGASLTMAITAPGKIAKAVLSFSGLGSAQPDAGIVSYIKSFTKGDAVVDLIENATVAKALSLPSGSAVKDQTSLSIDFSSLLLTLGIQANTKGSKTRLALQVVDALGKDALVEAILVVPSK